MKKFKDNYVRRTIIPDISVKMLDLCLSNDENGIIMPTTKRNGRNLAFRADSVLQDIITSRIENKNNLVPLVLRKKQIYDACVAKEQEKKINFLKTLEEYNCCPILMRKHLLYYKQERAQ